VVNAFDRATPARRADVRQRDEVMPSREQVALNWIRDAAAVALAPVVQLMPLALVLLTAGWQVRLKRRSTGPGEAHEDAKHERDRRGARMRGIETIDSEL
jgi:hypothetical protein